MRLKWWQRVSAIVLVLWAPQARAGQACPAWSDAFGLQGVNGIVRAFAPFDDGSGDALYVGGDFSEAFGVSAEKIGRWDGSTFSPVGTGMDDEVNILAVHDDGTGPALYAGGSFVVADGAAALGVARWDGTSWSQVGAGLNDEVHDLFVYDDGAGPKLYAAGAFTQSGTQPAEYVARWDGVLWQSVGLSSGLGVCYDLEVHTDDTGPKLHVGFGGGVRRLIANIWVPTINSLPVRTIKSFDDGNGLALYAGGLLIAPTSGIVRLKAGVLEGVGGGANGVVESIEVHDDGTGPDLYICGGFSMSGGGSSIANVARWDGTNLVPLGAGVAGPGSTAQAIGTFDDGSGAPSAGAHHPFVDEPVAVLVALVAELGARGDAALAEVPAAGDAGRDPAEADPDPVPLREAHRGRPHDARAARERGIRVAVGRRDRRAVHVPGGVRLVAVLAHLAAGPVPVAIGVYALRGVAGRQEEEGGSEGQAQGAHGGRIAPSETTVPSGHVAVVGLGARGCRRRAPPGGAPRPDPIEGRDPPELPPRRALPRADDPAGAEAPAVHRRAQRRGAPVHAGSARLDQPLRGQEEQLLRVRDRQRPRAVERVPDPQAEQLPLARAVQGRSGLRPHPPDPLREGPRRRAREEEGVPAEERVLRLGDELRLAQRARRPGHQHRLRHDRHAPQHGRGRHRAAPRSRR